DEIAAGQVSDPYLFSGYDHRQLHLSHRSNQPITFTLEIDARGTEEWTRLDEITVPENGAISRVFNEVESGAWIRLRAETAASGVSAQFQFANRDQRGTGNADQFKGIATPGQPADTYGLMRSLSYDRAGLVAATRPDGSDARYYELTQKMELLPVDDPVAADQLVRDVAQPTASYTVDDASVVVIEDGQRYRLPRSDHYPSANESAATSGQPLEAFLSDNRALGATITTSSTHQEYKGENVIDGNLDDESRWIGQSNGEPKWITLDLGEPATFQNLWVVTGWKNGTTSVAETFEIQIPADDGNGWQTIPDGNITANKQARREITLSEPVTTRKVRLLSRTPGFFRVYEIALFEQRPDIEETAFSRYGTPRVCREVDTERDLVNVHGTFYELPARNAQGLAKVRPIATHNLAIHDFCSHNGLLFLTGIDSTTRSEHIFRSEDGRAAVWAGVVDDLWKLGKPRGQGGPWRNTKVNADQPSDPFLMTGYDRKQVQLSATEEAVLTIEVDVDGTGLWIPYRRFDVKADTPVDHAFPEGFNAYWVRAVSDRSTTTSVVFTYN
ncbi:MAG: discoidin domain-containing protein, partial [Verrucomicrobiota bacterium]